MARAKLLITALFWGGYKTIKSLKQRHIILSAYVAIILLSCFSFINCFYEHTRSPAHLALALSLSAHKLYLLIMLKNSALVFGLLSKQPRTQLVTVLAPTFCTPLITIQKWELSMTTPTPSGSTASTIASTI